MVKTPKCLASFSSGQQAKSNLDCWPATCRGAAPCCPAHSNNTTHHDLLFFVPNMSSLGVISGTQPWCQRGDPNKLCGHFLKIWLNVGRIILSDLLIWQFVLTHCVQCGPACYWVIFYLMPVEQFNLHNPLGLADMHVIYRVCLSRNHDGCCAWLKRKKKSNKKHPQLYPAPCVIPQQV